VQKNASNGGKSYSGKAPYEDTYYEYYKNYDLELQHYDLEEGIAYFEKELTRCNFISYAIRTQVIRYNKKEKHWFWGEVDDKSKLIYILEISASW